ncbi:FAD-binding protein [Cryobacterium sp. M91]|uniref:FAD-binding protein n=1 Tax=Cryobacterium sp. M91 TaxID=2048294 RepID=UPI000CE40A7F|nr:FAD-binding protein [Cryobacterium sp. M91]
MRLPGSDLRGGFLPALLDIVGASNVTIDAEARVWHTGGKSTPDLIRLRSGDGHAAPDAIVTAGSHEQVVEIITLCSQHRIVLVPFGGGSSVVGGLGVVPVGRGNDFACQLGIPGDVGPGALNVIAPDRSEPGQT